MPVKLPLYKYFTNNAKSLLKFLYAFKIRKEYKSILCFKIFSQKSTMKFHLVLEPFNFVSPAQLFLKIED